MELPKLNEQVFFTVKTETIDITYSDVFKVYLGHPVFFINEGLCFAVGQIVNWNNELSELKDN